ncbi:hypothetical protein NDU88_004991 [Pleurodeles waltl]|uniref:Uncharacterized protein n=1 Tax=Pleurodeles waltl TaxID=8319 RepID=A0AAV7V2Q8_PLEWA|nr:hypothetical protein NDU88_004991 [Pleurodeles waltl]
MMPTLGHFDVCAKTYLYTDASVNFVLEYVPGPKNVVPDFLSCSSVDSSEEPDDEVIINWVRETAINEEEWNLAVEKDSDRRVLREFIVKGWPEYKDIPDSLKGYWIVRDELTLNGN